MRILFITERAEEHLAHVRFVITVRVGEVPDVRNAPRDATGLVIRLVPGQHAGGNVQPIGEVGDLVGLAITIGVFEDLDRIAAVFDTRPLLVRPA